MVPKLTRMPLAMLAAMPTVMRTWRSVCSSSFAAHSAAPNVPTVPEVWKPPS